MKKIFIIILFAFSAHVVFAQNHSDAEMTKKEKKRAELEEKFQFVKEMLEDKNFVLEADFLQNRYGNRNFVSSTINFIKVNENDAVIQVGSDRGMGYNGVGGITADGRISNWELEADEKKKTFRLSLSVLTNIGAYDVHYFINPHRQATARLSGMRAGSLTFEGDIVALENSVVYEGHSL